MNCPINCGQVCSVKCEWYDHDRQSCAVKLIGESLSSIAHDVRSGTIWELKENTGYIYSALTMKRR
jgi:hypothetical protein